MRCDVTENRPTFVLSNDDIYNLGHYINDVMMVWNMVTLANKSPKDSILINIDGRSREYIGIFNQVIEMIVMHLLLRYSRRRSGWRPCSSSNGTIRP